MNWTKTLPTKSGFYWQDEDGHRFMVYVYIDSDCEEVFDFSGHDWTLKEEEFWKPLWFGPLSPPQFSEEQDT